MPNLYKTNTFLMKINKHTLLCYYIWLTLSMCYFLLYLMRVAPSLMLEELSNEFAIGYDVIGLIGAAFYYIYAIMQIPCGIILDRHPLHKVVTISMLLSIVGSLAMYMANNYIMLLIARFIIGIGSASFLLCIIKFVTEHLSSKHRALFLGMTLSLGISGPIFANQYIALIMNIHGWRIIFFLLAFVGGILLLLTLSIRKIDNNSFGSNNAKPLDIQLLQTSTSPTMIKYGLSSLAVYALIAVFFDFWGIHFLINQYELNKIDSINLNNWGYIGVIIGNILIPFAALKSKKDDHIILLSILVALGLFTYMLVYSVNTTLLIAIYLCLGITCGATMLCFSRLISSVDKRSIGISSGILNTYNMMGVAFIEQLIGILIQNYNQYHLMIGKYFFGFLPILCSMIIATMFFLATKINKSNNIAYDLYQSNNVT